MATLAAAVVVVLHLVRNPYAMYVSDVFVSFVLEVCPQQHRPILNTLARTHLGECKPELKFNSSPPPIHSALSPCITLSVDRLVACECVCVCVRVFVVSSCVLVKEKQPDQRPRTIPIVPAVNCY